MAKGTQANIHAQRDGRGKGLDIGTAFIYSAEQEKSKINFRSQRDAFFDFEYGDFTREMLSKAKVNYIQGGDRLFVVGNEAMEFANIFHKEARRPLSRGVISPKEKEALPMLELIIKSIVGKPKYKGQLLYFTVPGAPRDADFNVVYHEKVLKAMLERMGYFPKPINEGMAVVFAELQNKDFTGIGLSFGAGMVNMCLGFMSVPVVTFSLTRSGDWIDQQVATALDETASHVCAIKEKSLDLTRVNRGKVENALSIYYDHLIEYVLKNIKKEFEETPKMPRIDKPVTIVLSGGTTLPKGFLQRFKKALGEIKFPLEVGEVRQAANPLHSVVRGTLIAAMADRGEGAPRR